MSKFPALMHGTVEYAILRVKYMTIWTITIVICYDSLSLANSRSQTRSANMHELLLLWTSNTRQEQLFHGSEVQLKYYYFSLCLHKFMSVATLPLVSTVYVPSFESMLVPWKPRVHEHFLRQCGHICLLSRLVPEHSHKFEIEYQVITCPPIITCSDQWCSQKLHRRIENTDNCLNLQWCKRPRRDKQQTCKDNAWGKAEGNRSMTLNNSATHVKFINRIPRAHGHTAAYNLRDSSSAQLTKKKRLN